MESIDKRKMRATYQCEGGKGVVYFSEEFKVEDIIMQYILLPPGSSIGRHKNQDGLLEYRVIKGPEMTTNGVDKKVVIYDEYVEHDCVNQTDEEIKILTIKTRD